MLQTNRVRGIMMDFELTKEQQDIVKAAREFAIGEFTDHVVRRSGNAEEDQIQ